MRSDTVTKRIPSPAGTATRVSEPPNLLFLVPSVRVMQLDRAADHSTPSGAKLQNARSFTALPSLSSTGTTISS
jgi:hypothetical protein